MIRPVGTRDLDTIAMIESRLFARPLSRGDLEKLLARPAGRGTVFEDGDGRVTSYVLLMNAGSQCRYGVAWHRPEGAAGRGLASSLLTSALQDLADEGVEEVILEVAVDNDAAMALYGAAGFAEVARRRGYYRRERQCRCAIVMRRNLAQGSA